MKEVTINADLSATVLESPIPKPAKGEVLIKVSVFGANPKDWKFPAWQNMSMKTGDDLAGIVEAVGPDVVDFKKGDRVAGFHDASQPHGTFAEYALVPAYACFVIPENTTDEEAATIPLAALTAAMGLFHSLGLPSPWWRPEDRDNAPLNSIPLLIYGASTAVGAFAIKLARRANIHPVVAVGSSTSKPFTDAYLDPSQGDALVDYRAHSTPQGTVDAIRAAFANAGVQPGRVYYALDCVAENGSFEDILHPALYAQAGFTDRGPTVASVLPPKPLPWNGVANVAINVLWVHFEREGQVFARRFSDLFAEGLKEGWFTPHPHEVLPGGFEGLEAGLKRLQSGTVRAKKLVGRPSEIPSL